MNVNVNWPKFILLTIAQLGMVALVITGAASWEQVSGPFGLIVGYGTANGLGAARNLPTRDLFTPADPHRRRSDAEALPPPSTDG